jgi:hypothetical protein
VFNGWEAVGLQDNIYSNLLGSLYFNKQIKTVVSLNGMRNLDLLASEACQFAQSGLDNTYKLVEFDSILPADLTELGINSERVEDEEAIVRGRELARKYILSVKSLTTSPR